MALFNESLEGRFSQLVQRLHSMKGASPVPQVAPEISHAIQINDDLDHLAHLFLARVTRYSTIVFQAADATHFAGVQFLNPANSGVLVQIEYADCQIGVAGDTVDVRTFAAVIPPGTTGTSFPLDTRENPNKKSAVTNVANNQIVGLSGNRLGIVSAPASVFQPAAVCRGLILAPGAALTFFSGAVNKSLQVNVIHRERAVSPAELLL